MFAASPAETSAGAAPPRAARAWLLTQAGSSVHTTKPSRRPPSPSPRSLAPLRPKRQLCRYAAQAIGGGGGAPAEYPARGSSQRPPPLPLLLGVGPARAGRGGGTGIWPQVVGPAPKGSRVRGFGPCGPDAARTQRRADGPAPAAGREKGGLGRIWSGPNRSFTASGRTDRNPSRCGGLGGGGGAAGGCGRWRRRSRRGRRRCSTDRGPGAGAEWLGGGGGGYHVTGRVFSPRVGRRGRGRGVTGRRGSTHGSTRIFKSGPDSRLGYSGHGRIRGPDIGAQYPSRSRMLCPRLYPRLGLKPRLNSRL